jgi:hypothetical protein
MQVPNFAILAKLAIAKFAIAKLAGEKPLLIKTANVA